MKPSKSAFKSGFVAVIGHPNVGKSTLINALLGIKIAAVSPWPQTTRKRQMGILTTEQSQIVFIDTPGIHRPIHKLGVFMNQEATKVLEECDLVLFIVDGSQPPNEEDQMITTLLNEQKRVIPILIALNKVDLIVGSTIERQRALYQTLLPRAILTPISAIRGDQLDVLLDQITAHLPEGTSFFPEDQVTDLYEREIAADLIHEAVLNHLRAEVPHSIAVRIDEYKERDNQAAYIASTLFVERESQKGIVIGQGGEMLKKIGSSARKAIETLSGRKIYLQIRVKVRKNWRNDEAALKSFGFNQ